MAESIQTDTSLITTEDKLNVILSNALCCSSELADKVAKMYLIGNKCADSELRKLKLLIDKIKALRKYKFPISNTNSIYSTVFLESYYYPYTEVLESDIAEYIDLYVNDVLYVITPDNVSTSEQLIIAKLQELGVYVDSYIQDFNSLRYELTCNVTQFNFIIYYEFLAESEVIETFDFNFNIFQQGICPVTYLNCLTEEQLDDLSHDIMKECDICDCQLT